VRIKVSTHFDITETGVTRPYKGQQLPTRVRGQTIDTVDEWDVKRKQQNNLETVIQVLSMRASILDMSVVTHNNDVWSFTFEVEDLLVYGTELELLKQELEGIPMITGLSETKKLDAFLNNKNTWFDVDV
jgi:hypothetical protein